MWANNCIQDTHVELLPCQRVFWWRASLISPFKSSNNNKTHLQQCPLGGQEVPWTLTVYASFCFLEAFHSLNLIFQVLSSGAWLLVKRWCTLIGGTRVRVWYLWYFIFLWVLLYINMIILYYICKSIFFVVTNSYFQFLKFCRVVFIVNWKI